MLAYLDRLDTFPTLAGWGGPGWALDHPLSHGMVIHSFIHSLPLPLPHLYPLLVPVRYRRIPQRKSAA